MSTTERLVARLEAELAPLPTTPRLSYPELTRRVARRRARRRRAYGGTAAITLLAAAAAVVGLLAVHNGSPDRASITPLAPSTTAATGAAGGIDGEQYGTGAVPDGRGIQLSYTGKPLTRRSFQGGSVEVPTGWVETNASLPSDHSDYLFYDPSNPTARFEVTESGCVGCASKGGDDVTPNPSAPAGTVSSVALPGGRSVAFTERPWLGYAVNGVEVILTGAQNGGTGPIGGYALYRVALPMDDTALETTILNSVRLT